ncbi:hypothetical protein OIM93_11550 [Clostridium chauvoei]|uniref:hypothetical protein n=1 Tax=Clostridium chauvoei TaxID=46867 RepID=UPI0020795538|nr:hypothetical protein [Clostridium chauvoei]
MKKFIYYVGVMILLFTLIGCEKIDGKNIGTTKIPRNNLLSVEGVWRVDLVNIVDETLNTTENDDMVGTNIKIGNKSVEMRDKVYIKPEYKLKVVDKDYILSYEVGLTVEPFMKNEDKIDIISIVSKNNLVGEFILQDKDKGFLLYKGLVLELSRIKDNIEEKDYKKNDENHIESIITADYNSDVGVMIGLKVPRKETEDGEYTKEEYRTLWISFKDGELQPIIEKRDIIFPRMNGIWTLNSNSINFNGHEVEYFNVKPIEGKESTSVSYDKNNNIYKNIKFIGNDYIAIEKYEGNNFKNKFPKYQIVPIDNINSENGIIIEEIYSKDAVEKYKMTYENEINNLSEESKAKLNTNIDYSNFSILRKDGKWKLVGKISPLNGEDNGIDYMIGLNPNKKLLNYDSLITPWKTLKGELPFIRDAYIAPTGRISIIIFEDNLAVYEVENRRLKGSPLINISLNHDEQVIMAEWSRDSYVDSWSKAFSDGVNIMEKEE